MFREWIGKDKFKEELERGKRISGEYCYSS